MDTFKNFETLKNKKTKSDEKLSILKLIDLENNNDEYKLKLITYLLSVSGDRDIEVKNKSNE